MTGKGNGNGNGGDLGHALTGMARLPAGASEPKPAAPENSAQPAVVKPAEVPVARIVPTPPPAAAPRNATGPVPVADDEPGEEITPVASAVGAKPAVEAASSSGERPAAVQKPAESSTGTSTRDSGGGGGSGGEVEQEAARDARLLRFVYVMAALTGIVAIVLYAGGWLREGPNQRAPEESVASAPAPNAAPAETQTGATSPAPEASGPAASQAPGETQAIPPAPPVVPPTAAEPKPAEPETPVTTGGPAKQQSDALPSMPSGAAPDAASTASPLPAPVGVPMIPVPSGPAETAGPADTPPSGSGVEAGSAPAETANAGASSPKAAATDESAAGKQVRDVPNLRVLAPALVKPEPTEGAASPAQPSAGAPDPGGIPVLTAPKETQAAAVPKVAPVKPPKSAAGGSEYLIQLASVNSEKLAEREWARLQKAFPDVFGGRKLTVEKKEIAGRGTFYRVQAGGYSTLDEARAACNGLKEKKQACLPVNR